MSWPLFFSLCSCPCHAVFRFRCSSRSNSFSLCKNQPQLSKRHILQKVPFLKKPAHIYLANSLQTPTISSVSVVHVSEVHTESLVYGEPL